MTVSVTRNWMAAMDAIAEVIRVQNLPDIKRDVHVQTERFDDSSYRPGCYVTPTDVREGRNTNSRDDKGYGCMVTVVRGKANSRGEKPDRTTGWEESLYRLFHSKRLPGLVLPTGHAMLPCKVETPIENADRQVKQRDQQMEAVSLVVRVWFRELRT